MNELKKFWNEYKVYIQNDMLWTLLAMIATRATHSSLSVELRKRFWQPLGFRNTYLSLEESIPQHQMAHVWGDNFDNDVRYAYLARN